MLVSSVYINAQGETIVWSDDFEGDWTQNWYAESGTWEVGEPTIGPDGAHLGENCAGTNLNGVYNVYADSRFVSPPVTVPEASENPRLRFWHWFNFYNNDDDWGKVQIRVDGSTDWIDVTEVYNDNSTVWTYMFIDLTPYAGQTVQLAFLFHSDGSASDEGWYIDDILLEDNTDLTVDAGPDVIVSSGSPATLNATVSGGTQPYTFEWTPADGLSDPSILNPVASPSDTTVYTVKVTDDNGCFRTDKVIVME